MNGLKGLALSPPMKTIGDYLAGKPVGKEQKMIIRRALFHLLFLYWRGFANRLPKLVISKELPLMELPFLSDREKRGWALALTETGISLTREARLCREGGKIFLRGTGYGEREPGERHPPKITVQSEVVASIGDLDDYLRQERRGYSTDFEMLRVCILLYRSRSEWMAEELAVMREGGMKVAAKAYERRFYRADW